MATRPTVIALVKPFPDPVLGGLYGPLNAQASARVREWPARSRPNDTDQKTEWPHRVPFSAGERSKIAGGSARRLSIL